MPKIRKRNISRFLNMLSHADIIISFFRSNNAAIIFDILDMSLSNLVLQEYSSFSIIERIIKMEKFTQIAIKRLQTNSDEIAKTIPKSTVMMVIDCLKSPNVNVGPPSIKLLTDFLSNELLDDSDIKRELNGFLEMQAPTEVKCRIYEVAVALSIKGYSQFERVRFVLDSIIDETKKANNDDVLLQLNLLEILKSLCVQNYGLDYLGDKGLLQDLAKKIETIGEDPLVNLMVPGLMKFFASIAVLYPNKILRNFPVLIDMLNDCLLNDSDDLSLIYSALDTLGNLWNNDEGKKTLDSNFGEQTCQVLSKIYQNLPTYQGEVKNRALSCLEHAFVVDDSDEMMNNQIVYICQKWIDAVFGDTNLQLLYNYCNTPFNDLSMCSYGLLKSLVRHQGGRKKLAATGGFVESLLDRKLGISYEVKKIKYEIIETLSKSSDFNATFIALFSKYVREGPNFVEPMVEVAFETN